jgi:hypothetical protein
LKNDVSLNTGNFHGDSVLFNLGDGRGVSKAQHRGPVYPRRFQLSSGDSLGSLPRVAQQFRGPVSEVLPLCVIVDYAGLAGPNTFTCCLATGGRERPL